MKNDKHIRSKWPASRFCDCREIKSLTAAEKAAIVNDWEKFVLWRVATPQKDIDGLPGTDYGSKAPAAFTRRLYHAWSQYFGHIAHYDIHGFFHVQMADPEAFGRNLDAAARKDVNHFNTWGAYHDADDLNDAMQEVSLPYLGLWQAKERERVACMRAHNLDSAKATLEGAGYSVTKVG
jgi:hypothetical protein